MVTLYPHYNTVHHFKQPKHSGDLTTLPDLVLTVLGSSHFVSVFLTVGLTGFGVRSTFGPLRSGEE